MIKPAVLPLRVFYYRFAEGANLCQMLASISQHKNVVRHGLLRYVVLMLLF